MSIQHEATQHKFADGQAELDYRLPAAGIIDFIRTFVPEDRRNAGEGEALARAGLDYARQHELQVRATCPFIASFMQEHSEYADLLEK